jgi:glycosyltransferase involved in cell wall biosynthesis
VSSRLGSRVAGKVRAVGRRARHRVGRRRATQQAASGIPREVVEQHTHLGPVMDAAVRRTRSRMLPAGVDADYDLAYEHFDLTHFLQQARHMLELPRIDPLRVFLDNGPEAKASPEINFNMQAYLARHPEVLEARERSPYVHWLRRGRAAGQIADPAPGLEKMAPVLGMTPAALADLLADTRSDLQGRLRTGRLGEMFARATEVEPLIGEVWTATTAPLLPPLVSANAVDQVAAIHACQQAAGFAPARLVLVVTEPRWGGGRRVEGHVAHALVRDHIDPHDIVVVYTDASGVAPPGRFPPGVREVDFARAVDGVARPAALRALVELVRSFDADSVININSRLLYEAMATYGRALAATERVFLMMFGNEQLAMGNWVGIPLRFFYRCFDLAEGVLTDSEHLADWLRHRHQLGPESGGDRIHVLRAPVDPTLPVVEAPPADDAARRPQVFWAGRWDRQKRVDIALEVARRMPDVDVRMWGEAVLTAGHLGEVPDNVRLEGRYDHFTDIDLAAADAWLYTSAWDGVPSQLLEVAMTGVPVVASLVGGVGEILHRSDSWPVEQWEDPDAYVAALREVLADPAAARKRSSALRDRLLQERTEEDYARQVGSVLLHDVPREGEE